MDGKSLLKILTDIDVSYFLLALACSLGTIIFSIYRWKLILHMMSKNIGTFKVIEIAAQSLAISCVVPGGTMGGDAYRSYKIYKLYPEEGKINSTKSILVDRFSGLWCLNLLSAVALLILYFQNIKIILDGSLKLYSIGLLIVLLTPVLLPIFKYNIFVKNILYKNKVLRQKFVQTMNIIETSKRYLYRTVTISCMAQIMSALNFWFCCLAVGIDINFWVVTYCSTFIFLMSVVPISFAGFGPRELGSVAILSFFIHGNEALLLSSLLYGLTQVFIGLVSLPWYMKSST